MTDDPLDAMKARWNHIQGYLFPWLREEVDPMTEALGRLVTTLDVIGLEAFVPEPPRGAGRPPDDRRALARAFVAKAVLGVPTTTALIERLDVDKSLRRILGWERRSQVPSEATFSRAFAEFAQGDLPDKMHAALIERSLGRRIVGVIARDATEIEAREKPVKTEPNDKKEDPPPPDGAQPTRKRGRPRKDEERPKPEPTRLERQTTQNLDQMLADLPTACDVGSKKNSKGYKETWIGYKLHLDVACGQIPVSCVLTSASVHDSQVGQRTDLSDLPLPEPERSTKAWGWLASLGLGIVCAVTGQIPALGALSLFQERGLSSAKLEGLASDGVAVIILICVSTPVQVGLLFWFARRKVPSALGYLALRLPRGRDIPLLILVAAVLLAAGDGLGWLFGTRIVTPFQTDIYRSARTGDALPWLWLTTVMVAPVGEETLFRGFLFRGWQRSSSSGPWIAIGATALLWAVVHVQYNALIIGQVLLVGLAFGWVRWATGSTVSTILLHAGFNAVGMTETYFALRV